MLKKIEGIENILTMFSVFHDGVINQYTKDKSTIQFNVEIQYLTERIKPSFKAFHVTLYDVSNISFTIWPNDAEAKPVIYTDTRTIFTSELEILSSEVENNSIKVACNQPLPNLGYCGAFLKLSTTSAVVRDEAQKEYSIEELCSLSDAYWDEWEKNNKV